MALAALCAPAVLVAGCDSSPWVDSRREAGTLRSVGDSTPDIPAICYDPGTTTASQLQSMADQVCAKTKRHARYIGMTRWQCTVATPYRAYYRCE